MKKNSYYVRPTFEDYLENINKDESGNIFLKLLPRPIKKIDLRKNTSRLANTKQRVLNLLHGIRTKFNNMFGKLKQHRKKSKKTTKLEQELAKSQRKNVILGIGLLLVVVSIIYSTAVIYIGVNSNASRLALLPQVVFALFTLFKAFSKLYK